MYRIAIEAYMIFTTHVIRLSRREPLFKVVMFPNYSFHAYISRKQLNETYVGKLQSHTYV